MTMNQVPQIMLTVDLPVQSVLNRFCQKLRSKSRYYGIILLPLIQVTVAQQTITELHTTFLIICEFFILQSRVHFMLLLRMNVFYLYLEKLWSIEPAVNYTFTSVSITKYGEILQSVFAFWTPEKNTEFHGVLCS